MRTEIQFFGAAEEVTGSCHLVEVGDRRILLDCGLIQGGRRDEERNRQPFPFDPKSIDAVVLSHAHIDHSGRLPLLVKAGFGGPIYAQPATGDLCRIMLKDAGYLNERDAEWENRKRLRKGLRRVAPLYTMADAERVMSRFEPLGYGEEKAILPHAAVRLADAGHILGSSIVELWLGGAARRKVVFSGDLGRSGMPVLQDPALIEDADWVILESTYGDRLHRGWDETRAEIEGVFNDTLAKQRGNILIPSFAVGRTQEILYLFAKYFDDWRLERWQIFLDSPLAIEATEVYADNSELFDKESARLWRRHQGESLLPNLHFTRTAEESMQINRIRSGAIVIAGSGMCDGGRIKQHLKHNIWRTDCQIVIVGFQARGTLGRALVDGAQFIRLWGETVRVAAAVHTIGGLSAHADQNGLVRWYSNFRERPRLVLVHGERSALDGLAACLQAELGVAAHIARPGEKIAL